jgi:uncharacterized protein (TIGR02453 family)
VVTETAFSGFTREGIQFLADLAANNDRAWFQPRKAEYERLLKEPLAALCLALGERFEKAGLPLKSDPARSPFRIYRDVRFSADKSPYKTQISASFPWIGEGGGVGGYFHFAPGDIFAGGGMWHPEPARIASWRRKIVDRWYEVEATIADPRFVETFGEVNGDSSSRSTPLPFRYWPCLPAWSPRRAGRDGSGRDSGRARQIRLASAEVRWWRRHVAR